MMIVMLTSAALVLMNASAGAKIPVDAANTHMKMSRWRKNPWSTCLGTKKRT